MQAVALALGGGAVVVLIGLSAFFSSSESAIFTLAGREPRADSAASDDPRRAELDRLMADPHRLLVTILVGNNVVNICVSSLVTVGLVAYLPRGSAVLATTVVTSVVVLVFGEIVPKSYGLGNAERWALAVARPIGVVEVVLGPAVTVFDALTRRFSGVLGGDLRIETTYLE